ncbi:unnamed protein product [Schistosoma margrebowiei]|uniref:Uncharacterized protein n=1 Tax=Schistosoma margrebowiei TaxID=48269 RepID=A0A183MNR0_9TREM|nr:unnamed protein product [Schistosoma margrebowiei]
MVEPTGAYVPANMARLGHHDRQTRPPRQGSSFDRAYTYLKSISVPLRRLVFEKLNECSSLGGYQRHSWLELEDGVQP